MGSRNAEGLSECTTYIQLLKLDLSSGNQSSSEIIRYLDKKNNPVIDKDSLIRIKPI